jgi:signal transduction histidine kinase
MKNILVIEDDKTVREGIIDLLKEENYTVAGAENGAVGLAYAQEIIPDLIISDILMPELDGYGVLAKLQENPLTASIPVIFLSAMTGDSDIRAGMRIGADDYLTKPYKAQDLLDAVNARLNKAARHDKKFEEMNNVIIRTLPHELRTPLVTILGYSQLLADSPGEYNLEEIKSLAESIQSSGYDLLEIIQKFLTHNEVHAAYIDKSRLSAIKTSSLHKAETYIRHFVKSVAEKNKRDNDITFDLNDASVKISDYYLKIIIEEIVGNALKFSSPGSPVKISSIVERGFYKLVVADKGVGMSKDQIRSVGLLKQFDREKNFQNGLGIGLSLVKKLVHLHDGELNIKSEAGKGTTVIVLLPVL